MMKYFLLILGMLVCFACGADPGGDSEYVAGKTQELCTYRVRGEVQTAFEQPGGSCGLYFSTPMRNPTSFYLNSQTAYTNSNTGAVCYWLRAGTCNQLTIPKKVYSFSNTMLCTGFPGGDFQLDLSIAGTSITKITKNGPNECTSTYDVALNQVFY